MKKLLTLVAMAAAVMSVNAKTLWTGTCTFAGYQVVSGERPVFSTADFADAIVGDKIIFNITNNENDTEDWHQVEMWQYDGEKPGPAAITNPGVHVLPGMTSAEFTIDETLLSDLLAGPTCVAGTGYTVRSIELTTFDGTVWEGECSCPDWVPNPAVTLPGSKFATAQEGDHLVFTLEKINPGEYASIQIDKASTFSAGPFGTHEIADGQTTVDIVLTAELLASLVTDGINITGMNFKLTKIELVKGTGEVPPTDSDAIWTGEEVIGSWDDYFSVPADKFGNVRAGDSLVFTVSNISGDDPQFCIKSNLPDGWGEMPSDLGEWGNYIHVDSGDGEYAFAINAEAATLINQYGLTIAGGGVYTFTKIVLVAAPVAEDAIWTGTLIAGDWVNNIIIEAEKCAGIVEGSVLAFTVTDADANGQIAIKSNLPGGWGEMPSDLGEWGNYIHVDGGAGVYTFTVNQTAATLMNQYGFVVAGLGYTLTKIALLEGSGIADVSVNPNAAAPVYNLQGVKVADTIDGVNTPGIYISAGKKFILK